MRPRGRRGPPDEGRLGLPRQLAKSPRRSRGDQTRTRRPGAVPCSAGPRQLAPSGRCRAQGVRRSSPGALGLCSAREALSSGRLAGGAAPSRQSGAQPALRSCTALRGHSVALWGPPGGAALRGRSVTLRGAQGLLRGAHALSGRSGAVQRSGGAQQRAPSWPCSAQQAIRRAAGTQELLSAQGALSGARGASRWYSAQGALSDAQGCSGVAQGRSSAQRVLRGCAVLNRRSATGA